MQEVEIVLSASSIYRFNTVQVVCRSDASFYLKRWKGDLLYVHKGQYELGKGIRAVLEEGKYQIILEFQGWFNEVETSFRWFQRKTFISYGMRFYPFISAVLSGFLEIPGSSIKSIEFRVPNDYRIIWYLAKVYGERGESKEITHVHHEATARYIFRFNCSDTNSKVVLELPIRLAGIKLFQLVQVPVYYSLIALPPLAAIAFRGASSDLVIGTLAAVFAFLLEKLDLPSLPQRSTFLLHLYLVIAGFLLIWTGTWAFFRWYGLLLLVPFGIGWSALVMAVRQFSHTGRLPGWLERYWALQIYWADRYSRLRASLFRRGGK